MRHFIYAISLLVLVLVILFFPVIFQNKILLPADHLNTMVLPYSYGKAINVYNHFLNDVFTQYYIYKSIAKDALSQGNFTYWNPFILGGYPQYALTMAGNFDITNIVLPLFRDVYPAFVFQLLLLFFISGLSMYLLLRYYKNNFLVSIFAAISYMLNSMFVTTAFHHWILASFCWMPLVILFLDKSLRGNRLTDYILCAIFLGIAFMAASIQVSLFLFMFTVFYIFSYCLFNRLKFDRILLNIKCLGIIMFFAIGLTMFMWLPTGELFFYSNKFVNFGAARESLWQRILAFPFLISFAVPELAGSVRAFDLTKAINSTLTHFNGYIGFFSLVFAMLAFAYKRKDKHGSIFLAIALLGIFVPLCTPLLNFFYHRFFIIYMFGACLLSALGLTFYINLRDKKRVLGFVNLISVILISIFAFICILNMLMGIYHSAVYEIIKKYIQGHIYQANLIPGSSDWYFARITKVFEHFSLFSATMFVPFFLIFSGILVFYLNISNRISNRKFLLILIFINSAQLIFFARSWFPMVDPYKFPLYPKNEAVDFLKQDKDIFRVKIYDTDPASHPIFSPNVLSMYNIETINGYESIESPTANWLIKGIDPKTLGLLNVKYLITHANYKNNISRDFKEVYSNRGISIFMNSLFMPRARMVYNYKILPAGEILKGIRDHAIDMENFVFFDKTPPLSIAYDGAASPMNKVIINKYSSQAIEVTVNTGREGYLVLSNTYYPGWQCLLDGKRVPVLRADYSLSSVYVLEGEHKLAFFFKPYIFYLGAVISVGVFICMIIILSITAVRNKK